MKTFTLMTLIVLSLSTLAMGQTETIRLKDGSPANCSASRFVGRTVSEAIDACVVRGGISRRECASTVVCAGGVDLCKASGYAGRSIREAINVCVSIGGLTKWQCTRTVSCSHTVPLCTVRGGFAGSSLNEAIQTCSFLGSITRGQCSETQYITCSPGQRVCTTIGRSGGSAQDAEFNCADDGMANDACREHIDCND